MTDRGHETTLAGPRRCPYCGHRAEWRDKWPMWRYGKEWVAVVPLDALVPLLATLAVAE